MMDNDARAWKPLICVGHQKTVTHLSFSRIAITDKGEDEYYLISACKDKLPMLRDGKTGDWIGTFFGHKGAAYQARMSPDTEFAATASADFTTVVWDAKTGKGIRTIKHGHIVRAVAYPPNSSTLLATGGMEKKLRIIELPSVPATPLGTLRDIPHVDISCVEMDGIKISAGVQEIGDGVHKGAIKAIVWTQDPNILVTAADDNVIRWWDLRTKLLIQEKLASGNIGSCELSTPGGAEDIGGGLPVLTIAAGKTVYFYGGPMATTLLRSIDLPYDVLSVALHPGQRKFVTGRADGKDCSLRVYNYGMENMGKELAEIKGHSGPVWSISFSPDGKLYASGSDDGTIMMWKNCTEDYGLWQTPAMTKNEASYSDKHTLQRPAYLHGTSHSLTIKSADGSV